MVARLARLARLASTLTATIFGSTSTSVHDVYSSRDSTTPGRVVFVAIHRSTSAKVAAINRQPLSGTAYLYQMTAASAQNRTPVRTCPCRLLHHHHSPARERHDPRRALNHCRRGPRGSVGPAFCVLRSVRASCFVGFKPRTFSAPHQKTCLTRMRLNFIL